MADPLAESFRDPGAARDELAGCHAAPLTRVAEAPMVASPSPVMVTWLKLVQPSARILMSAPRRSSGRGSATVRVCLPASSDPKNCFGYMIERRAALFRVVRLPDGMIYDCVSERSAT